MIRMKPMLQKILIVLFLAFLSASTAQAANAPVPVLPDLSSNPTLVNMVKLGAKVYYIGTRSGLDGWFIFKEGRVQVAYTTADKKVLVMGAMFGENGENITSAQVKSLMETNKEVSTLMSNALQEQQAQAANAATQAVPNITPSGAAPTVPVVPTTVASVPVTQAVPVMPSVPALPAAAPAPLSPGERLLQDFSTAAGVNVGAGGSKVYMVMDPGCPHCMDTWRKLRDAVFGGVMQIKMIPIAKPGSDDERAAGQLLLSPDPLNTWDKYVGPVKGQGDKNQLAGTPDATAIAAVHANHVLTDSWHIDQTPYFAYRGHDGKVKIVMGEPQNLIAMLADLVN